MRNEPSAIRNEPSAIRNEPSSMRNEPSAMRNEPSATRNDCRATRNDCRATRNDPCATRNDPCATLNDPGALHFSLYLLNFGRKRRKHNRFRLQSISVMNFSDPELLDPVIHCFARCFLCKKLIPIAMGEDGLMIGERKCPHCGVFLEEDQILRSFAENFFNTSAITSANKLIALDLAILPYLAANLLVTYMQFPIWFRLINVVIYHMPIILLLKWLYKYWYRFRFTDDEYIEALKGIRKSLALWVFANVLNWLLLLI